MIPLPPSETLSRKGLKLSNLVNPAEAIDEGDRVAFVTTDRRPRALCGIVVAINIEDSQGRRRHRVVTKRGQYWAHPNAIRRLKCRIR